LRREYAISYVWFSRDPLIMPAHIELIALAVSFCIRALCLILKRGTLWSPDNAL
jgi:hypothetical protein